MRETWEQDASAEVTPTMPPVLLKPEAELRLAAERTPLLDDVRGYVAGLDENMEPRDALTPRWAEASGLVRVVKGKHVPLTSLDDPLRLWERLFSAIGEAGPPAAGQLLPRAVASISLTLYQSGQAQVPVELLFEAVELGQAPDESTRYATTVALDLLDRLGAIEQVTADPAGLAMIAEIAGKPDPFPFLVSLTPLAVWAINRELREAGMDAPVIGEASGESLGELSLRLIDSAPEIIDAELKAWVRHRSPSDAAAEASEFLRAARLPEERLFALIALGETGEIGLETVVSVRAEGGLVGAAAAMWLSERGAVDRETITRDEVVLGMADHFAAMHALGAFVHQLADMDDGFDVVDLLTSSRHPDRLELLNVVGANHPDRDLAKKARTASFKLRSSGAQTRHA
ncbi:hypothetical protein SAMN04489729_4180 [Amycolatopsis lurida]|uniref:Uncharacterized protein n=1 Tax=Amycolatopsis lurida NRRL 2430 TaxID=1460371 RepID=A0A2P2G1Y3_AMYLU|nr:hypothetical protein [Amycolatopsis lurida]KFU82978.1 hypothetical protein BB31_00385 [Amycolatopsis lurida NRRL 2430]SED37869.1 hypothetical protein SAMN04489729_4180 [Amycolatopsis lurida]